MDKGRSANWGNLIIAIDPGKLGSSPEGFCSSVTALLQRVKGARKAPGVQDITLPGERGSLHAGKSSPSALVLNCAGLSGYRLLLKVLLKTEHIGWARLVVQCRHRLCVTADPSSNRDGCSECYAEECRAAGVVTMTSSLYDKLCCAARIGISARAHPQDAPTPEADPSGGA